MFNNLHMGIVGGIVGGFGGALGYKSYDSYGWTGIVILVLAITVVITVGIWLFLKLTPIQENKIQ